MKYFIMPSLVFFLLACNDRTAKEEKSPIPLIGTWQLVIGITVTKGDSIVTDYTKGQQMIKIINDTHFAFLKHDVNTPKDSSLHFDAGGGRYTLQGNHYTEHLDFYNDRNWEGKTFQFNVTINGDTLTQK